MEPARSDTPATERERVAAIHRSMTPEQRLLTALELSESMRMVSAAGIQARHPEYNEQALFDALARLMLGDELFVEAFPNRPLLAP